jgi:secondary thiamine-phosphate synthase enzyme
MGAHHASFFVATRGRGTYEVTADVAHAVAAAAIETGLATVFVHHTSASVLISENADPTVRSDLERFLARIAPDGDPLFQHDAEGDDDMPAHVRSVLTGVSVGVPVVNGRLELGTWQGIYLYEHRLAPHRRRVSVTVIGEKRGAT